jgi:hypothetical protein
MAKTTTSSTSKITEVATQIVKLLAPLESAERQKVIRASLMLLGESPIVSAAAPQSPEVSGKSQGHGVPGLPPKATAWAKQNGITSEQLSDLFEIDGTQVTVIASEVPGKNKKEKTINAYVIQGLAQVLASDDGTFDDKSARSLCSTFGCYDQANHATNIVGIGNNLIGTKDKGWKLTAPGLKKAADIVKELTKKGA